jgi:hypothetical protein
VRGSSSTLLVFDKGGRFDGTYEGSRREVEGIRLVVVLSMVDE